jgi:glycosyltransferase involved in cell wall biosynthesis
MHIVIVGQAYYPGNNGQAVFTINLAEGLARIGHKVAAIVPSTNLHTQRTIRNGVTILGVAALHLKFIHDNTYYTPLSYGSINHFFNEFRPEIVHIQDHYLLSQAALRAAKKWRIPSIGTNHFLPQNIIHYLRLPVWTQERVNRLLWRIMFDVYKHLDFVTTPTQTAAQILRRQNLKMPIQAVSCGVNLSQFQPDPTVNRYEVHQRYGLDPQKITLLYVGRVDKEKDLEVLIQALYQLQRDDLQIIIVGQGKHLETLRSLATELGLAGKVVFTNYVPDEDLPALFNSADIFAMPSQAELQSIATLEAMASGRPILAANARALPELVDNGVNGYLFRAGDIKDAARRIGQLVEERARWPAMGLASQQKVQPHTLDNTLRRYETLYQYINPNAHPVTKPFRYEQWVSI